MALAIKRKRQQDCRGASVSHQVEREQLLERWARLSPHLELAARIAFRGRSPDERDELIQECRALGWKRFVRLVARGKCPTGFIKSFCRYVTAHVGSGRTCVGHAKNKDVFRPDVQRRYGFSREELPASGLDTFNEAINRPGGQRKRDEWEDVLSSRGQWPIPDQVAFRLDWKNFLRRLTGRERQAIRLLARGERPSDVAESLGISRTRISQLRAQCRQKWHAFTGE